MTDETTLRSWIESRAQVDVKFMQRLAGGGSREAWRIDAQNKGGGERALFMRRDLGHGPVSGSELTLAREARLCLELSRHDIPVSEVVAYNDEMDVVLAERAAGDGDANSATLATSPYRAKIISDFMRLLAKLHSIPTEALDLPDFERPAAVEDHALIDVRRWKRLYLDKVRRREPILEAAFLWLEQNAPRRVERTVLVHGDCGPGNFMFEGDHVTCIVDWEFAHFGDPMDDIAWLGFRQDGSNAFKDMDGSLAEWEAASGLRLDQARISYYGLLVLVRCAVCCVRGLANAGETIDNSVWHGLQPRMLRAIAYLMADLEGVDPGPEQLVEPGEDSETSRIVSTLLRDLETVIVPELTSPNASKRARGDIRLLRHLQWAVRTDAATEVAEVSDVAAILGRSCRSSAGAIADVVEWVTTHGPGDANVVRYLCRRADRMFAAWRPLAPDVGKAAKYPQLYDPHRRG